MAITNFIPEIWSAALLKALRDRLTYAQSGVINRNYEGDIARAGDTVHITSFADPSVRSYTKNSGTPITWDLLTDATRALVVDQADYFAFKVDDVDKRQAMGGFVEEATVGASYNLAAEADAYVAGLMVAGASNDEGAVTVGAAEGDAYDLLVDLRTALTKTNTPADGRFVVVPPEMYAVLLKDDRFISEYAAGTTAGLRNGIVGRAAGFDVIESNVVPSSGGGEDPVVFDVVAGHSIATTFAEQIGSTEALRLEGSFADGIRGLHLYGGLVVRGENLAKAQVTVS